MKKIVTICAMFLLAFGVTFSQVQAQGKGQRIERSTASTTVWTAAETGSMAGWIARAIASTGAWISGGSD